MKVQKESKRSNSLEKILTYVAGLLSSAQRKTCLSMAKKLGVSSSKLQRILGDKNNISSMTSMLISLANRMIQERKCEGYLIIDDTTHGKPYAKNIPGLAKIYCSSLRQYLTGFKGVWIVWTDGIIAIPLAMLPWYGKDAFGRGPGYQKKAELARKIIIGIIDRIDCCEVLADAFYCSQEMIDFFEQFNLHFCMRIPSNRKISRVRDQKGMKLNLNKSFRPKRNSRTKTTAGYINGKRIFITAYKIRNKRECGWSIIYCATNYKPKEPQKVVQRYKKRWRIEMFFRTAKRSLGYNHCQARSVEKHIAHSMFIGVAYTFLEITKVSKNFSSTEEALESFQDPKSSFSPTSITPIHDVFHAFA